MENIKLNAVENQPKLDNFKGSIDIKTPNESDKLTDNTSEGHKTINEIKTEQEAKQALVQYIGTGIWVDEHNKYWANRSISDSSVSCERCYSIEEYNERKDLLFMVSYGQMRVSFI